MSAAFFTTETEVLLALLESIWEANTTLTPQLDTVGANLLAGVAIGCISYASVLITSSIVENSSGSLIVPY